MSWNRLGATHNQRELASVLTIAARSELLGPDLPFHEYAGMTLRAPAAILAANVAGLHLL